MMYAKKLEEEGLHEAVEKIVKHFPHLEELAKNDAKNFALNATSLVAVDGVAIVDYWKLAKIATSNGWGGRRKGAGAPIKDIHKETKSRGIRMTDAEYEKVKEFLNDLREEEKKMKKTINALFDACLDTSNDSYSDIIAAFNGVKATEKNKEIFGKVIRKCLEDYNEAYTDTGLEYANLNSEVGENAIKEKIDSLDGSIDTTESGQKYYRLGNWPTHDDEIKEKPSDKGAYMNDYYAEKI